MNKQIKLIVFISLFALALSPLIIAEDRTTNTVQEELGEKDCYNESDLNELINQRNIISEERDYYKNLSGYYEGLYLSKEINVSNREFIALNQYIYILNQNITDLSTEIGELKQEVTFFNLTIKLTLSLLSITLLGALAKWSIKKWKLKQKVTHISTKISLSQ